MDERSAAALIQQQYFGLLSLIRRKIRDEQLAPDILNQAIVTSLEHIRAGRIADPSLIAGYVFQVAMNQMRNHRRKMAERSERRADPDTVDTLPDLQVSADDGIEPAIAGRVRSLVQSLPTARDREIVKRFYLDEEEKESICRDLRLSALHFDKVIFRARQRMRSLLEASGIHKLDVFPKVLLCLAGI